MKIKFLEFKNSNLSLFKLKIKERLLALGNKLDWDEKELSSLSNKSGLLKNVLEEGEVVILPSNVLEYPLNSSFEVISVIDYSEIDDINLEFNQFVIIALKSIDGLDGLFKDIDIRNNYGKVYITGFGPGDPDLLTVKAVKAIESADVIYYDDLIDQEFLNQYDKEKIYVGKRKDNHSHSQDEIDEILYQSAISGKNTVRLKGGDPFIYGRGGEEFDYLRKRFVDVEVIPGITAAFGAAASTGISLTQRGVSSSVAFCTGYPRENRRIPDADTLVFYMSASVLQETAQLLIKKGRRRNTPVALVRNATREKQEEKFTNLEKLANGEDTLPSPIVVIIGDVAANKNYNKALYFEAKRKEELEAIFK